MSGFKNPVVRIPAFSPRKTDEMEIDGDCQKCCADDPAGPAPPQFPIMTFPDNTLLLFNANPIVYDTP